MLDSFLQLQITLFRVRAMLTETHRMTQIALQTQLALPLTWERKFSPQ